MEEKPKQYTPLQAWEVIKNYCAYQERCHSDVANKLFNHGLNAEEVALITSRLIEENYLNEERFSQQYAGGHFRMKQWGRIKIIHAMRMKGISDYCIKKGLKEIEEDDYQQVLVKLAQQQWVKTKGKSPAARWVATKNFLLQKGFETHLVLAQLKLLQHSQP